MNIPFQYTIIDRVLTLLPQKDGTIVVDSRRHCPECLRPLASEGLVEHADKSYCFREWNEGICCPMSPYDPESIYLFGEPGDIDFPRSLIESYDRSRCKI
jgi:hypothetical protein